MEARARGTLAAIFMLFSIFSPLASGSSWFENFKEFFGNGGKPEQEPWINDGKIRSGNKEEVNLLFVNEGPLSEGFYEKTCPRAEEIVRDVVEKAVQNQSGLAASLLRLHFHDCFVKGCDGSLLLDNTPSNETTEKYASANGITLRGFEVIDDAKSQLEKECPGIVSCADILAFAARDSVVLSGVPSYSVLSGRRDSLTSRAENVGDNLPTPRDSIDNVTEVFVRKGLTLEDMVVLLGSHSIGVAHCGNFVYRLQKPNARTELNPKLVRDIRQACPPNQKNTLHFDRATPDKMDAGFYKQLLKKKGLLEFDQVVADDAKTRDLVKELASHERMWFEMFAKSIIRMGNLEVLTGTEGEIRKQCRFVN